MNAFRQTKDGSLDRQYLRASAVYRCIARFGMQRAEAMRRLTEVMPQRDAAALVSLWRGSHPVRVGNPAFASGANS